MAADHITVEYRDIPDFPGYRAGSDGSVWSCRAFRRGGFTSEWRRLKPHTSRSGHLYLTLCNDSRHVVTVHTLILTTFIGPCPPGLECCHDDGNPANNALTNLRWDTPKANAEDRKRHGRQPVGAAVNGAKLTEDQVRSIRMRFADGEKAPDIAHLYKVRVGTIRFILAGKTWKHVV